MICGWFVGLYFLRKILHNNAERRIDIMMSQHFFFIIIDFYVRRHFYFLYLFEDDLEVVQRYDVVWKI